uniref:Uncharacterized protein n=1 Tax=Fagus sylvatica TaxID=28930 RepID=A0A2N9HQU5_FAGSY
MHCRRRSPLPPLMEVFGSARPSLASLSLSAFLSPSRFLSHGIHGFPLSLKLTAHSHSQPLDLGEPVYGSRVLCEPLCVAVWVIFRVNPWVVDVWPWAL